MPHEAKRKAARSQAQQAKPLRTCVGCGAKRSPAEMLRVASRDGAEPVVSAPRARKAEGRGAYLCVDLKCCERAVSRRALERALKLKCGLPHASRDEIVRVIVESSTRIDGSSRDAEGIADG
jgi:predicted RNA-binding protein YlxR (DUF448 family)